MKFFPTIFGRLMRVGTMQVSGEELTGAAISVPREAIEALAAVPMYRDVMIVEAESFLSAVRDLSTDMHQRSDRPCPTCERMTQVIGQPFGCVAFRQIKEAARPAVPR